MPPPPLNLHPSPKLKANFFSNIFFWWLNGLFKKGYRQNLELKDLYASLPEDDSSVLGDTFAETWAEEERRAKTKGRILLRVLWKIFGWRFVGIGFVKFFEECISKIASPIALGFLIGYFMEKYDLTVGLLAGGAIVLGLILNIATMHVYFLAIEHLGMQIRLACSTALYRKALKLKLSTLNGSTTGQLMNIMSNDVNRFDNLQHIHYLWIGLTQTGISTFILWKSFGAPCLCGLAVLILFVPFQGFLGSIFTKLRTRTAAITDKRIRAMNEILNGIRVIKMHCWENIFANLVNSIRKEEMLAFTKITALRSINWSLYYTSSKVTIFLTLIFYVLGGDALTAEKVFVAVSLYNNIRITMTLHFPLGIAQLADCFVSLRRVQKFLLLEERPYPNNLMVIINKESNSAFPGVLMENVYASWESEDASSGGVEDGRQQQMVISDGSLDVHNNQLVAVVGTVGSGKSSLLQVLLQELPPLKGKVNVRGKVSYASQEAWIFSGTVQDNITFGKALNPVWYNRVVDACALRRDFELFAPYGDQTVIGDRGVNLSGGQKARICLARAVYNRKADIFLLDDPLSAVDAEVARHIFDECLKKLLKQKIVILVTHQLQFLQSVDNIIVMDKGRFIAQGSYEQLLNSGLELHNLIPSNDQNSSDSNKKTSAKKESFDQFYENYENEEVSSLPISFYTVEGHMKQLTKSGNAGDLASNEISSVDIIAAPMGPPVGDGDSTNLEEETSSGSVKFGVYRKYFGVGSNVCSVLMLVVFNILTQLLHTGSDYWLQIWCKYHENNYAPGNTSVRMNDESRSSDEYNETTMFPFTNLHQAPEASSLTGQGIDSTLKNQIMLYCSIIVFLFIFSIIRTTTFFQICISSSIHLHRQMLTGVMRAPMRFFDLNSSGRILNRFTKDTDLMDDAMPQTFFESMEIFLNVIGIIVLVCIVSPYILIPTTFLAVAFYYIRRVYVRSARSVKRLEAVARSPVYSHLTATIHGLTTIRAFQTEENFRNTFSQHQNLHSSTWFLTIAMTRWIGMWLDWISVGFVTAVVLTLIFTAKQITGPEAGMAISAAMFLTGVFQWGVRQSATVESQMVSIERILDYTKLEPEAAYKSEFRNKPPDGWPSRGKIDMIDVYLRYGNNRPILKGISISVKPQEKVGIVGRTGAGKSSLITALFRLAEPTGRIEIDGVNILSLGLHDLRSKISIIPQDPFLFNGTLRKNLSTNKNYSDSDLWAALGDVGLADTFRSSPMGLDSEISEGGGNFSVGERQLLCLARAILRQNKILILDEATASVDLETDNLVQRTIREKFKSCTVLTIAHRLFTIMDSDRVLVMDEGYAKEFDSPYVLLQKEHGLLKSMMQQTGAESSERLYRIAAQAYMEKNYSDFTNSTSAGVSHA